MAISTTTVQAPIATGDGADTSWPYVIQTFENDAENVIEVFLDGVLQTYTTHYTIAETASTGNPKISPGGTVNFVTAPGTGVKIKIKRNSLKTQQTDLSGTAFPPDSVEKMVDKNLMLIQELDFANSEQISLAAGSALSSITFPVEVENLFVKWNHDKTALETSEAVPAHELAKDYKIGNMVTEANVIYKANTLHTSDAVSFSNDSAKWDAQSGPAGAIGATGPKGIKGDKGDTGSQGVAGANGSAGAAGIFSAIASQAEAETGTDNTKGMTPLRVKQAIDKFVPLTTQVAANKTQSATNKTDISGHNGRIQALESNVPIGRATGHQRINDNQVATVAIEGKDSSGQGGQGNTLQLNPTGATSARIEVEIQRKTDLEFLFSSVVLLLQYVNGTWFLARETTTVLSGDPDGVTFSVTQDGDNVAQIHYTSTNLAGVYDAVNSFVRYRMWEISSAFVAS